MEKLTETISNLERTNFTAGWYPNLVTEREAVREAIRTDHEMEFYRNGRSDYHIWASTDKKWRLLSAARFIEKCHSDYSGGDSISSLILKDYVFDDSLQEGCTAAEVVEAANLRGIRELVCPRQGPTLPSLERFSVDPTFTPI